MSGIEYAGKLSGGALFGGSVPPVKVRKVWFDYGSDQIFLGSVLCYSINADPENAAFNALYPGMSTTIPSADLVGVSTIAGVVIDLGDTAGLADGWVTVQQPIRGEVVTLAVAVAIDMVDYANLSAAGFSADGSTTQALLNIGKCLYDEDSANNPHGASALSAAAGLVEVAWIGGSSAS